jgi:hypothetical protein
MTTKERLHELVDELTDEEATRVLELVEREHEDPLSRAVANAPEDEWGDLNAQTDAAAGDLMARLDEEEIAEFGETISQAWGYENPA